MWALVPDFTAPGLSPFPNIQGLFSQTPIGMPGFNLRAEPGDGKAEKVLGSVLGYPSRGSILWSSGFQWSGIVLTGHSEFPELPTVFVVTSDVRTLDEQSQSHRRSFHFL